MAVLARTGTSWYACHSEWLSRGFHTRLGVAAMGRAPYGKNRPHIVATIHTLRVGPFRKFWAKTYGPQADYWRERLKELRWARHPRPAERHCG